MNSDVEHIKAAVDQARVGRDEGGIPIGAALAIDGEIIATGRNRRVQLGSAIRHAETDCLENAGRLSASTYRRSTLYTTLSPCHLCAGAVLLYGIPRVVIGENETFSATEEMLRTYGVALTVLRLDSCKSMMREFISAYPDLWNEDIGVDEPNVSDNRLSRSQAIITPGHSLPKGNI